EYSSDDEGYKEDRGLGIVVDADCNIYVTGLSTKSDHTEIVTQKYDTTGVALWTKFEDGTVNENGLNGSGLCIAVGASGNVFVGGYITTGTGTDMIAIKYNSEGTQQWTRAINGGGNEEDKAWGIVVDSYENSYITGYVTDAVNHADCYTAKIGSTGNILWEKAYNGGENQSDKAWGIIVDTDGSVYITGETTVENNNVNYLTIKYDNNGNEIWDEFYNGTGSGNDIASAIGIILNADSTKSVIITGKSWGVDNNYDYATVRYSTVNGSQSQVSRYSMSGISSDVSKDLAIAPDNSVYITGFSQLIIDMPVAPSYVSTMKLNWGQSSELTTIKNSPNKFSLHQNYPNPFNPSTTIAFEIPQGANVKLVIYDMLGRQTDVLINQYLNAGSHNISYSNLNLSSGIYFYELTAGSYRDIKKMTLIK
ncbi:MAG: T9SS type A sorting domain-containing protein, partial [Ignavibacteria bacterium]